MVTDADIISALGGPTALSLKLGLRRSAASNWGKRGIPPEHHLTIWRMALEVGSDWQPPGADALRPLLAASEKAAA
jgi:hypothetical protein